MNKSSARFRLSVTIFNCLGVLLSVLMIPFPGKAQSESEKGLPFITNYTPKTFKALPQTWCVQEDDRGVMYFGIQSYILEYDGVKWKKIIPGNTPSTVVRSLAKFKDGRIYFGAYGDLGYLDKDSIGQTKAVSLLEFIPKGERDFLDIWTAYTTDNSIYFQARSHIFRFTKSNKEGKQQWEVKVWKPQSRFMYAFYLDGDYYVHQQNLGLYKMINDSLALIPGSEFLGKERMQVMLPYPAAPNGEKQWLMGMFYSGLYIYDGKTFREFNTAADPVIKSGSILYKGIQLKNGSYALATTGKGLVIIDAKGNQLQKLNRSVGLQDESVYATFLDKKGTLWLALDNGISRVEIGSPLTQFTLQSGINTGVLSVQRIGRDLYIGTTNGLLVYDSSKQFFEPVPGIPQNQIFNLLVDGNDLLVPGDGLFAVRNKKAFTIRPSVSADLTISAIYITRKNPDLLITGGQFGIAVFNRKHANDVSKEHTTWHFAGNVPGINEQIWSFAEDKDGTMWAGSANSVVYRLNLAFDANDNLDTTKTIVETFGPKQGVNNLIGFVYSIKSNSFFTSDSGLYTFDSNKKQFIHDTLFGKSFKIDPTEFALVEDPQGRIWMRDGKEIFLAIPKPGGGFLIDKSQLSSLSEYTVQNFYPEKTGIVWLGTTDGLVRYDENLEKNNEQSFKTILRHITAGKTALNSDFDSTQKSVSVSFKNNTLRFEYAAPFFEQEDKTRYQTWLEGFEDNWSELDNNYYKEYTNLSPGKYTFHVRAVNIYQKQSDVATYSFEILPPWYRTWWAYLIYALVAGAVIYSIVRWRTRQLHEKHKELEKLVEQRTHELSHRVEELAVINSVQEGLVREMGMEGIYELVGEKIRQIFNAQVIDIVTYDKNSNLLEDHYSYEKGDRTLVGKWEPKGFRKHVIETKQLFVINENLDKKSIEFNSQVIHGEQPKSCVFVPMISAGNVTGMISLQNLDRENAFSEAHVSLLTTLANSMSVALESARRFETTNRLLKETEQRNAELAVINSVQESLVAKMDMQGIYELVGEKIREIFDAQVIDIVTFDRKVNLIEDRYSYEKGDRTLLGPREPKGFRRHVIQTGQLLLHNENVEEAMRVFDNQVLIGEMPKSQVYVPMIAGGEVKGVISLQNLDHEHAFSESDVNLVTTLANSMSVALESARLFDETKRLLKETEQRNAELAVINSVQESLVAKMDMQGIYELVGEKIREIFDAQVIDIVTYNPHTKQIEDRYAYEKGDRTLLGPRDVKGFRKHVIETKQSLLHNENVEQAMKDFDNEVLIGEKPKSQLYVPMIAGGDVKGVISLQNLDHEYAFSDSDISLLTTLANSMSVALESARLFDETKRLLKETEQRTAELAVINSVQDGLAKELDMQGVYDLVGDRVQQLFNAQTVIIGSFDAENKVEYFNYFFEYGEKYKPEPRPINKVRQLLIEKKRSLYIPTEEMAKKAYGLTPVPGTKMTRSLLFVPLLSGSIVKGYVSLQNVDKEHAFSESDIRLLETLANSMSVALENARLFDETNRLLKETEQRTAELAVINSVQEGLAKELDMQAIYDLVGNKIQQVFNAQAVIIANLDTESKTEDFKFLIEKGERFYLQSRPYDKLRQQLVNSKEKILINSEFPKAAALFGLKVLPGTEYPKSLLFVPLISGDKVKSYVSLQNMDSENAFSDSDVRLLETLANTMSVALENARLFDETNRLLKETEQRTAELAIINSVQEGLASKLDIQSIYDLVGDKIRDVFDTQGIAISYYDEKNNFITNPYYLFKGKRIAQMGFELGKGLTSHIIQTGQPLLINENAAERFKELGAVFVATETEDTAKSWVGVPLMSGGQVNGTIRLENYEREFAYNETDVSLLQTLANSMSVALENARLFDETSRLLKETEQRTAELAVINSVQEGLASELNMQAIYDLVGEKMREIFNAQVIDIVTYDETKNLIEDRYGYEKGDRTLTGPRPLKGFRKHVIESGRTLVINKDVEMFRAQFDNTPVGQGAKSVVFVPMVAGGKVTGVISLQNLDIENAFPESDVRLLTTLVNSMSVALENARLFDETSRLLKETEQRTAELAVINSVQEGLAKELDIQGIYELVGDRLCSLFPDTQTLVIRTFDHDAGMDHFHYAIEKGVRFPIESRPLNWSSKELTATKKPLDIRTNYMEIAKQHGGTGVTKGQPPKSAVFVPMIVGDVVRGSVSLQNVDRENAFTDSDLRLLTTITNSMSVALENARLFDETNRLLKETEQRTAEMAVINSVQEGLVREMNMQAIYDLVGTRICDLFDTQTVLIRTFDHRNNLEIWQYAIEKGTRLYSNPRPTIWANKLLIETKQPLLINENYLETAQKHGGSGVSKGLPPKSALFVPMIVGDVVRGSVSLQNVEKEHAFTESDLRLLTTLTNSMSVALENARLFDETNRLLGEAKQRANELATVNSISQGLASQLNLDELIKMVGDQLRQLFRANIIYLAILDEKTKTIHFPYQYGDDMQPIKLGEGLTSNIILSRQPLLVNKDIQEMRQHLGVKQIGIPAASYLGVPIPVGDEVIGVLSVQSTEHENRFNEDDLRLLGTIAASVGVALRKAKLFEEVQTAKLEAEEARKIAEKANDAKSAFLSTVSHELRTPLTSVLGFAKIIKKRLDEKIFPSTDKSDPKTVKTIQQISENLKVVVSEGERLTHLINDVLDLAKIEAGKMEWNMETVSMPEVAERAIAATSALFEQHNLFLEKNIDPDIPDITGDRDKLIQVMVNLISNAVKFTPKGKVVCNVFQKDKEIIVSVTDTGIGIAPEDHAAVFEQFKQVGDTLTDKPKGTGLGLPICKEIVEHHGGRIWLESELGKGSTFLFALPVTKTSRKEKPIHIEDLVRQLKEQVAQSQLNIAGKPPTILIVDDDDSIRSLLHQELSDAGYMIDEASNGKAALEQVRKNKPDLIILDIMMPEMNGFDVAAVLKNDPQTMDIPIIVLSIVQDKTRGFRIGVDRYLTKPIDTGVLFNEIGSLLEQGKSKKKVMIVDQDSNTVQTLTDVLKTKGYDVFDTDSQELVEKAVANQPDIIILNSMLSGKQDLVQSLRFEKGLENVLFLVYQ